MRRLDRHLLISVTLPFVLGIGLLVSVVFLFQARRLANASFGLGLTLADLAVIFGSALLPFMVLALPMALLFGVLVGLNQRARAQELKAWRAAGVSSWRLTFAPLLLGIVVSAASLPLALYGEPIGLRVLHARLIQVGLANLSEAVRPGVITEDFSGTAIYAGGRDAQGVLTSLVVFDERNPDRAALVTAARGTLKREHRSLAFEMEDGEVHLRGADQDGRYERLRFDTVRLGLDTQEELLRRTKFVSPLGMMMPDELLSLARRQEAGSPFGRRVEKVYWRRFALASMAFIFAVVGCGIVLGGRPDQRTRTAIFGLLAVLAFYIATRIADWCVVAFEGTTLIGAFAPNVLLLMYGLWALSRSDRARR